MCSEIDVYHPESHYFFKIIHVVIVVLWFGVIWGWNIPRIYNRVDIIIEKIPHLWSVLMKFTLREEFISAQILNIIPKANDIQHAQMTKCCRQQMSSLYRFNKHEKNTDVKRIS